MPAIDGFLRLCTSRIVAVVSQCPTILLALLTATRENTKMRVKLTDTAIRSYQPRAAQYSVGDAACAGLCLRITPKGIKSFAFAYRNKGTGKVQWLTIGRYPDVPLTRAREAAHDARKIAASGGTPLTPKIERAEAQKKPKHTPRSSRSTMMRTL
jgi:hypothetical protein